MQDLIKEAYRLFAPYTVHVPLNICTCECCMPEDCQHELLSYRLRDIPADNLAGYLGSVPLADEAATARDMKHFLPRILQALVNNEDVRSTDEGLLDKLRCPNAGQKMKSAGCTALQPPGLHTKSPLRATKSACLCGWPCSTLQASM